MAATGHCLCGAVHLRVEGPMRPVLHCHCENCRRATGNFVAASGCATDDLVIDDPDENFRWYDLGYARYGFCGACGSHLLWQGAEHRDRTSVQTGVLDDVSDLELAAVWFAEEAQPHTVVGPEVPRHSGNGDEAT